MIDYISGVITDLNPTQIVVENQGIGYISEISLQTFTALDGKKEAVVFIQRQINQRDGTYVDYGFSTKGERELFRLITSVSGMGASTARMILSSFTSDEFTEVILSENLNRLKSVKGLGIKTAQRLILELKDKLIKGEGTESTIPFMASASEAVDEATRALVMLGFAKPNISKVVQQIIKEQPNSKVEDIIKNALKKL